jgi:septal ring factor EnvC (AmiA/AmiB activator)
MVVIDLTGKQVWPEVATDSTEVEALRKQVADLTKEKESFHHDYRLRFDVRQKQLDIQVADLTAEVVRLKDQRRERIATAALQGLLAVPVDAPSKTFAIGALTAADALIAKLDGKEN